MDVPVRRCRLHSRTGMSKLRGKLRRRPMGSGLFDLRDPFDLLRYKLSLTLWVAKILGFRQNWRCPISRCGENPKECLVLPDDKLCYCFHVSQRKVRNFLRIHHPRVPGQISECGGAGWFLTCCPARTEPCVARNRSLRNVVCRECE